MKALINPIRNLFGKPQEPPSEPVAAPPQAGDGVTVHHLWHEQPNALKFQIDRNLLPFGEVRSFTSRDDAADAPLAQALFEVPGVASVQFESIAVTVTMTEDSDWDAALQSLPGMIRKFFAAGGVPVQGQASAGAPAAATAPTGSGKRYSFGFKQVEGRPREEQMRIVQDFFDHEVNPAVAAHGGYFTLLDIQDNNVYVELGGGCQGCGMANVTLRQGVEARLREVMPEMNQLIDQTDHQSGENPYYQAGKK